MMAKTPSGGLLISQGLTDEEITCPASACLSSNPLSMLQEAPCSELCVADQACLPIAFKAVGHSHSGCCCCWLTCRQCPVALALRPHNSLHH